MKSIIVLLVFGFQIQFCFAQFEKGKNAIGINLGFSFDNNTNDERSYYPNSRTFTVASNIQAERFLYKNLSMVIGFGLDRSDMHSSRRNIDTSNIPFLYEIDNTIRTIEAIIGIRKYWFINEGQFGLFVMPYGIVSFTKQQFKEKTFQYTYEWKDEYWSPYFKTDIGVCYFIKPNFSLELTSNILQAYVDEKRQYIYFLKDLQNFRYGFRYYF